jgi:asparagine synthase (glutamine-hydrolysing)
MCGICGEFNFSDDPVDASRITRMTDKLAHRGPDDAGVYCHGHIGMGHRRLSIIDLSSEASLPMWTQDGRYCIAYNGEVYNYREIRGELLDRGYRFNSESDTEVVLESIHCWGLEDALRRFIGMFAFALWDNRDGTLILCRDRVGVKPLYVHKSKDSPLFASEMKGLMAHPSFQKAIEIPALGQYFITGCFLGSNTVFRNTSKLLPGHYLKITRQGNMSLHKY